VHRRTHNGPSARRANLRPPPDLHELVAEERAQILSFAFNL
jgi:hypothetical protein